MHGGKDGFAHQFWNLIEHKDNHLILQLKSPHLDSQFPGSIKVTADFQVRDSILDLFYKAELDELNPTGLQTVVNLTNHTYFNLNGCESAELNSNSLTTILDHELYSSKVKAYLEQDANKIPTKRLIKLEDADFPLRINKDYVKLSDGCSKGYYDNSFVFETDANKYTANSVDYSESNRVDYSIELLSRQSGVKLEMLTNNFSCHLYTGPREKILNYSQQSGVCLEAQSFINSCNVPEWLNQCLITSEKPYTKFIIYRFSDLVN